MIRFRREPKLILSEGVLPKRVTQHIFWLVRFKSAPADLILFLSIFNDTVKNATFYSGKAQGELNLILNLHMNIILIAISTFIIACTQD